jgi:hypothetical protein
MTKALAVIKTDELYRIASISIFVLHSIKDGAKVECFNALLKQTRKGGRHYDRLVTFVFDSRLHKVVDKPNDLVLGHEQRRARELVCTKHHRGRCSPPPYEDRKTLEPKTISLDPEWGQRELLRVGKTLFEYLQTPQKFDRTKLSILTFDLSNVLGWYERRAKRVEGLHDEQIKESGPG